MILNVTEQNGITHCRVCGRDPISRYPSADEVKTATQTTC